MANGKPRRNGLAQALEADAVAILRTKGSNPKAINARLSARAWLMSKGWTIAEINAAAMEES